MAVDSPQLGRVALGDCDRAVTASLDHDAATRLILRRLQAGSCSGGSSLTRLSFADHLSYIPWLFNGIEYA